MKKYIVMLILAVVLIVITVLSSGCGSCSAPPWSDSDMEVIKASGEAGVPLFLIRTK